MNVNLALTVERNSKHLALRERNLAQTVPEDLKLTTPDRRIPRRKPNKIRVRAPLPSVNSTALVAYNYEVPFTKFCRAYKVLPKSPANPYIKPSTYRAAEKETRRPAVRDDVPSFAVWPFGRFAVLPLDLFTY